MGAVGNLIILLTSSLCLYLLWNLINFLHQVWWTPIRIQYVMGSQGIKGPPYRFIHGSTKEILNMRMESMSKPMDLSHNIVPRLQPHIYSWVNIYGKIFLNWYGPQAQLVVTDPELSKEILNNRDGTYPKAKLQGYAKKLLGDGLAVSEGEKWAKLRKLANHTFHAESLKSMIPAMIASVEMMLQRWQHYEGKEIEVLEEFRVLTSEVISRTAFGSSYLEGKNIFEMLRLLGLITSRNAYKIRFPGISKFFKTGDEIESEKLEQGIRNSIIKIIKKREEKVMTGEVESFGGDFLGLLIKANHDSDKNKRISVEDIVDECKTFYIAGQETTMTLLSWTVLLLSIHMDWQEKARKEVLELFGQQSPNSDGIPRLKTHFTMTLTYGEKMYTFSNQRDFRKGLLKLPTTTPLLFFPSAWGHEHA